MKTYIALLRGINVSGQKKIKMADLSAHLEDIGLSRVETYIQSGNIVFNHENLSQRELEDKITAKIKKEYGWEVPVIVKSMDEFEYVLNNNPLLERNDVEKLYVTFLSDTPSSQSIERLKEYDYSPEEYVLDGKVVFFYAPNGYGKAKMNNNFFESKLNVSATTRNWKTVNILYQMAIK